MRLSGLLEPVHLLFTLLLSTVAQNLARGLIELNLGPLLIH